MPFAAYRSLCGDNIKRIIRKSVRARAPHNYLFMGKTRGKHNFLPWAAVRCKVTLEFSRFWPVLFPKTERKSHVTIAYDTGYIAKTKFLEIPQDSHIEDPNKEDSDQTVQMRFLICVSVVRSTCVRSIYTRGDSFKLPFAEAAIVNLTKIYIMDHDMLLRTSLHIYPSFHDHKERVYLSKN